MIRTLDNEPQTIGSSVGDSHIQDPSIHFGTRAVGGVGAFELDCGTVSCTCGTKS